MADSGVVIAAQRGDANAFTTLVRERERSLHAVACTLLGAGPDANDAVQSALLAAWRELPKLRDPRAFDGWLSKILLNQCRMTLRSGRRVVAVEDPSALVDFAVYDVVGPEMTLDLFAAIRALDHMHREVVALRFFRDMTVDDIARTLKCPAGTVKSRINRALGKLSLLLDEANRTEVSS